MQDTRNQLAPSLRNTVKCAFCLLYSAILRILHLTGELHLLQKQLKRGANQRPTPSNNDPTRAMSLWKHPPLKHSSCKQLRTLELAKNEPLFVLELSSKVARQEKQLITLKPIMMTENVFSKFLNLREKRLWGNPFWEKGHFFDTVRTSEEIIRRHVRHQEKQERMEQHQ